MYDGLSVVVGSVVIGIAPASADSVERGVTVVVGAPEVVVAPAVVVASNGAGGAARPAGVSDAIRPPQSAAMRVTAPTARSPTPPSSALRTLTPSLTVVSDHKSVRRLAATSQPEPHFGRTSGGRSSAAVRRPPPDVIR